MSMLTRALPVRAWFAASGDRPPRPATARPGRARRFAIAATAALGAALITPLPALAAEAPPQPRDCPKRVPDGARCLDGRDSAGAPYLIVMPAKWTGVLVVHAHGGPALGPPKTSRSEEDIERWGITVRAGHAWAGSVFRQGGVAVRSAAEDTERVRRIFVEHVAKPRRTILHGQSWGASVAAKLGDMVAAPGLASPYDGVLLTSGVLAGGSRAYDFRLDLRVVYQHLCGNHPLPDEPAYPLWMGLPPDAKLTRAELARRVESCLGIKRPASERTPEQARRLQTIVDVIRVPEASIPAHLAWATWHFQDIAQHRTDGRNVFDNAQVRYRGSRDDDALNAAVLRYRADPAAVTAFAADTDPEGRIDVPVLTAHGIGDPTAFVEMESAFRETMTRAGQQDRLVQVFTDHKTHSYLSDATYLTLFDALLGWIERGQKPTPASIAAACAAHDTADGKECRFAPDYVPPPLESRIAPRR